MSEWQKVYEDDMAYRAEIVKAVLEEHELDPVIVNKKDSTYLFGHFEVHVASEHVVRALKIINDEIRFE